MSKTPLFTAKPVVAAIAGIDFTFTPSVMEANNYINEMTLTDKIVPAYNYLTRSVKTEQKDQLKELLDNVPGLVQELYQTVSSASKGDIKITLKN
ncbi:putative phage tail assembly chaperone [uncultured Vibrio sp.]|uniref:putative phage tail assembly chaperone n=1 Tax=uncultured Vibrio sp. TaxID=114054 RepID=UPI0025CB9549|nr:putative phage tail assembly chaperone [uncultured Vibrio sp.]